MHFVYEDSLAMGRLSEAKATQVVVLRESSSSATVLDD